MQGVTSIHIQVIRIHPQCQQLLNLFNGKIAALFDDFDEGNLVSGGT